MADSIEAAITSSISGLSGSDSSSSGESATAVADPVTPTATETPAGDAPAASDATPAVAHATTDTPALTAAETPVAATAANPAEDSLESLKTELAGKRDNRIPYSRVTKIVENAVTKAKAEAEASVAQFRTPEFQNGVTAMRVADERPEQFLAALAQADPRYAELLAGSKVLQGAQPEAGRGKAKSAPAAAPEGDVEPDIQLSDGTLGFSAEATKRREAAMRAEIRNEMMEAFEDRLRGLKPIEDEHRIKTLRSEAAGRVSKRIEAASKWPGFNEAKEAIAAKINEATQRGETLDLHDAYIQVVIPKYQTDEQTVRARVVAEMNKSAAAATKVAPGATRPAAEAAAQSDVDPIEAAIRASIKK